VTVDMIGVEFPSLDPGTDVYGPTDASMMSALYGGLFTAEANGTVGPGMVSSWKFSNDNKTLTLSIHKGIKFTDGSPLNAAAVAFNINRDLTPSYACSCDTAFKEVTSITATGPYTVTMQMSAPDPSQVIAFLDTQTNFPASMQAIQSEPLATFAQDPIGAGPFKVSSFASNSQVVLVKNPNYYIKGQPHLDQITFTITGVDQTAYASMETGQAQVILGLTTVPIIHEAKGPYQVLESKNVTQSDIELNSYAAPFNNILAREAVAYAINSKLILGAYSPGFGQTVEDEQGPGGVDYEKTVPGFRHYNLAKAQALVKQLGGLSFTLYIGTTAQAAVEGSALSNELTAAGMTVKVDPVTTQTDSNAISGGTFQASTATSGGINPDVGVAGLETRFASTGEYACCHDAALDGLINKTLQIANPAADARLFDQFYAEVTKEQYVVPLFSIPDAVLAVKSLTGMVVTPEILGVPTTLLNWGQVGFK
jgi:peptide/nickel transport system substrate-binding protein